MSNAILLLSPRGGEAGSGVLAPSLPFERARRRRLLRQIIMRTARTPSQPFPLEGKGFVER